MYNLMTFVGNFCLLKDILFLLKQVLFTIKTNNYALRKQNKKYFNNFLIVAYV